MKRREYRFAIEDFNVAIKLNPIQAESFRYRGLAKNELGIDGTADLDQAKSLESEMVVDEERLQNGSDGRDSN